MLYCQKAGERERERGKSFTSGSSLFTMHLHNPLPPNWCSSIKVLGMRPAVSAAKGDHQERKQENRKIAGGVWCTQTVALDATEP